MAFNIILYNTPSENNRVTKVLNNPLTLSGELREQTSILSPKVKVQSTGPLSNYNYAYIEQFGRYYYITDIESVINNIWLVSMRCDVLMSFDSEIRSLTCILARQNTIYSPYLEDPLISVSIDQRPTIKYFDKGFSKNLEYVLVTSGGYSHEESTGEVNSNG